MELDDVLYLILLFFSIGFGKIYRNIEDKNQRKLVGSAVGFLIVLIVSGIHIIHTFITILLNAVFILYLDKKQCHLISFLFSFLYLFFFRTTTYFGIPYPPAHTNLVQMMLTLKLVGLAFEVNSSYQSKKKLDEAEKSVEEKLQNKFNYVDPGFMDIVHYSFNYVGVLTGPYFRYKTFIDSFELPFSTHGPWKQATIDKIKFVPLYAALFLWGTYNWPLSYALSDEFYNERSWLYRLWYVWPNFFIFRMRIYIGLVLSECVCTMAGIGAYPVKTTPKPGHGPSGNFKEMQEIIDSPKKLILEKYDFETIHNINTYGSDFCVTFREGMKHWNICIQYWLAVNVYKRFPNKQFRTFVTMLVSAAWHGVYAGYYICVGCAPFYLLVEDIWVKIVLKDNKGVSLKIWEWVIFVSKMFAFSYLGIAFNLLSVERIIIYYNSVYHFGLVLGIVTYVCGLYILKTRKIRAKKNEKMKEEKKRE